MKRTKILNRRIEQIFKKKQDHDLVTKLKTIKPTIDVKCPESYVFFKTQFYPNKTEPKNPYLEQKKKIVNIKKRMKIKTKLIIKARNKDEKLPLHLLSSNNSNNNSNIKNHNALNHFISGRSLFETSKLFDDNANFSKRIKEKNSYYSLSQWKKDFKKSRVYKKISCEYPSINFVGKPKRKLKRKNQELSPRRMKNVFEDVRFVPISSFLSEHKRSENNSKEKIKTDTFNKIRRKKFLNIFEQNNKIINNNQNTNSNK
jgi:hypothetical protein